MNPPLNATAQFERLGTALARFAFLLGGDGDRFVHGADR